VDDPNLRKGQIDGLLGGKEGSQSARADLDAESSETGCLISQRLEKLIFIKTFAA
jgi:hypothetical protein